MDENLDEVIGAEVEELEIDVVEDDYVPPTKEEFEALKKENLTVKAQKEHFKRKAGKTQVDAPSNNSFTREEAVLIAQGMDLDDLDNLKAIQKGLGLKSFQEAVDSNLFKAYSNEKKAEKTRKDASLGASKGSGGSTDDKFIQGMSSEEHEKAWRESKK